MVIPSINRENFADAMHDIKAIERNARWAHLDVQDGRFVSRVTWNNPADLEGLKTSMKFEAHLMVEDPEIVAVDWLKAGVSRIIAHCEAIKDADAFRDVCALHGAEVGVAINPDTPLDTVIPYVAKFPFVLFLSVMPGPSGQEFIPATLDRIAALRSKFSDVTIEIDGGINLETALLARKAGANHFVSGGYIYSSPDPASAFEQLVRTVV
jgi:ribulose-phosphate 3-epimerase